MEQQTNNAWSIEIDLVVEKEYRKTQCFNKVFVQAVATAFSVLGNQAKQTILNHLELRYGIKKEGLGKDIKLFTFAIEEVFGQSARLLEMRIMAELHQKLPNVNFVVADGEEGFEFVDYVETFQRFCSS